MVQSHTSGARLLFRFFLDNNCLLPFDEWFEQRLPSNGHQLKLGLALIVIQHTLSKRLGNPQCVYLFLGIDEYQTIEKVHAHPKESYTSMLRELVDTIGKVHCAQSSKLVLLPMFAGTNFVTQRLPMWLLTIQQVFSFIESAEEFAGHLEYSQVRRNLFFLGGMPRWLVDYMLALKMESNVLSLDLLSRQQCLRLAAFALSGRLVQPNEWFDDKLKWSRLRDSSLCLLFPHSGGVSYKVNVSYSHFLIFKITSTEDNELSEAEKSPTVRVDSTLFDVQPWRLWEAFGVCFYALRINALLVLGQSTINLGELLYGAKMDDETSEIQVELAPFKVSKFAEPFGEKTGQFLSRLDSMVGLLKFQLETNQDEEGIPYR